MSASRRVSLRPGRPDSLNMLTLGRWRDDLTVEHIAPKTRPADGWPKTLYDDPDLVHSLGNLTKPPY